MAKVTFEKVNITYPNADEHQKLTICDFQVKVLDRGLGGVGVGDVDPSGCGKSTTLRSLAGLEQTGECLRLGPVTWLAGLRIVDVRQAVCRLVAMLFLRPR